MSETQVKVPAEAVLTMSDGASIAVRRWGAPKAQRMVISHGNGLAVDAFHAFGSALQNNFEIIAFDMRNHGTSGPGKVLSEPWPRFLNDIPEIFDGIQTVFGAKPTHGAFHSLSSASTLMAQGRDPRPWQSLSLFEPPVPPVEHAGLLERFNQMNLDLVHRTRVRRRRFETPERLIASFRKSPSFGGIKDAVLDRLARAVTYRTDADPLHPWELVCDPQMEANTYDTREFRGCWDELANVTCPVQIVIGTALGHDLPLLLQSTTLLARSFGFDAATVEGGSHLMQLQRPERCAELVATYAKKAASGCL
ncbi:alpha/beta hydrolase [Roseovarius aestuarii]|nr:alpha/beta hydrolase [Roseovarius aestuarii]